MSTVGNNAPAPAARQFGLTISAKASEPTTHTPPKLESLKPDGDGFEAKSSASKKTPKFIPAGAGGAMAAPSLEGGGVKAAGRQPRQALNDMLKNAAGQGSGGIPEMKRELDSKHELQHEIESIQSPIDPSINSK